MRKAEAIAVIAFLGLTSNICLASNTEQLDGTWQTTVSCEPLRGALGYSYQFDGEVKDSVYHGLHGTEGKPGSLVIDGKIAPDGSAKFYAKGMTGSKEFVPGRNTAPGTEFGYHIEARFKGDTGTGKRIEGRVCTLQFEKQ